MTVRLPPGKILWSADGTRALIAAQRLSSTGGRRQIVLEIDPRTMTLVEQDGSVTVYQRTNRHEDMRLEQLPIDVQREDQAVRASAPPKATPQRLTSPLDTLQNTWPSGTFSFCTRPLDTASFPI